MFKLTKILILVILIINNTYGKILDPINWVNNKAKENQIKNGIRIRMYFGPSIEVALNFSLENPMELYRVINPEKPVVLYIHGYTEHPKSESVQTVISAYLQHNQENILLLDWSELARGNYLTVINRLTSVSKVLAEYFDYLFDIGMNLKNFHAIGHSLGGQLVGFFGRYSKHTIPRITGLDPANPGFYLPGQDHIDKTSGELVDIIHTDSGFYGAGGDTGSADFYANSGSRVQPGCSLLGLPMSSTDFCSHWRSWRIYAESVNNMYAFPAVKCLSYLKFISGKCSNNEKIYIGYPTPQNSSGSYFFKTNSKYPFGKYS